MSFDEWYSTFWKWGSSSDEAKARRAWDKAREIDTWLIWSREHGGWWMPDSSGYTRDLDHAGRYSLEQAAAICEHANRYSEQIQETMFPAP